MPASFVGRFAPRLRRSLLGAGIAGAAVGCSPATVLPPDPPFDPIEYQRDFDRWRAGRTRSIGGPDGWTTLIGLFWLDGATFTVGSDSASDIVLPAGHVPERLGTLHVAEGLVRFDAAKGATVWRDGTAVDTITLRSDRDGKPTVLRSGGVTLRVIERSGQLALRVKDTASPDRLGFTGLSYFPVDSSLRVAGVLRRHSKPRTVKVGTVTGQVEEYASPGVVEFALGGRRLSLLAVQQPGSKSLFIIFRDSTSGKETYQAARFLQAPWPDSAGVTTLDFNRAYNPPCAFSAYSTCPLPPAENILPVAVRAGERRYGGGKGVAAKRVAAESRGLSVAAAGRGAAARER